MCQVVLLYNVVEIVVMSGEVACCSVVCQRLADLYGRQCVSTRVLSVRSRHL